MDLVAADHQLTSKAPKAGAPLTPQQGEAVTRREVSVVLSSGAGCGKTHVLTERYLSHLRDDGAEIGQIVAITFTDRAARQMRERIRRAVQHELQAAVGEADAGRWLRHLRGLETAQISTIHAFCGALLRQNAVAAGLDPTFDVLEDVLSVNFQKEALTACLQELLLSPETAGEDLRQLILLYGWRPTVEAVNQLVGQFDERAWEAWLAQAPETVARWLQVDERARLLPAYVDYLLAANPHIAGCLQLLKSTPCVGPLTQVNVGLVLTETPKLGRAKNLEAAVKELVEAAKVGKEKDKAWPSKEVYEEIRDALQHYRDELKKRLAPFLEEPGDVASSVIAGQRFLHVALEAVRAYQRRKRRAAVLDFEDLLVGARNLLRDRPEAREALQRRFRYLLVDELQDTDPVQMELVELLCGGELTAGKLFAVGDHKQSIYRFRGADVQQFQKLRQSMPHEGRLGLTVNFRSQPAILHFANALFSRRLQDYEPLRPHHEQINPGPCVEFLWSYREGGELVSEARAQEADALARRIAAMVGQPERLVAVREGTRTSLRAVRPGDIVLLFRAMSNVHLYEAALRKHGLDYYLVGGRAFFAQQEIYDVLNLLRALENPEDNVSLAGTLRSPFCCLSDEALFVLSRHPEGLWAGLHNAVSPGLLPPDQVEPLDRARHNLDRWRSLKDRLPIARLLAAVLADSGYDAALQFEFLGDRKLANLWKLQDLARTFDRSGLFGLAEFIARLGDLVRSQPREEQAATQPENADVVRLMTIHQAKGLEFPIVFVPDLAFTGRSPSQPVAFWDTRFGCVARPPTDEDPPPFSSLGYEFWRAREAIEDWHEDLRTLYVACTRAQDHLVLSASLPSSLRPTNSWMMALAERFDLKTGSCLADDLPREQIPRVRVLSGPELETLQSVGSLSNDKGTAGTEVVVRTADAGWSPEVAPLPLRLPSRLIVTLPQIEGLLEGQTSFEGGVAFDSEDGSDRTSWQGPATRLLPRATEQELVWRHVLQAWRFRGVEEWRPLLRAMTEGALFAEMERCFEGLVGSEWLAELLQAKEALLEQEFLVSLEEQRDGPILHGVWDCLWSDTKEQRHLLLFDFAESETDKLAKDATWLGRKPAVLLSAWALAQQEGRWPESAGLYHVPTATLFRATGKRLVYRKVLADARRVVSGLLLRGSE